MAPVLACCCVAAKKSVLTREVSGFSSGLGDDVCK
jgi:hypothetical protein